MPQPTMDAESREEVLSHLRQADSHLAHAQKGTPGSHHTRPAMLSIRTRIASLMRDIEREG